jgi:tRNA/tmRNA/rRNA uracil-C5-methylase (TrmA/RlmC/RlmD family)
MAEHPWWGVIPGLPPFYRANQLRTFLSTHAVPDALHIEKKSGETAAYLAYASALDFSRAQSAFPLELITSRGLRSLSLRPRPGDRTPIPAAPSSDVAAVPRIRSTAPRDVHKSVTPLYDMLYADQLTRKTRDIYFALVRCSRNLADLVGAAVPVVRGKRGRPNTTREEKDDSEDGNNDDDGGVGDDVTATAGVGAGAGAGAAPAAPPVLAPDAKLPLDMSWLRGRVDTLSGAMCVASLIVPSPAQRHYRNKVCWTAGLNEHGKCVWGFFCGSFASAAHEIAAADSYAHVQLAFMPIAAAGNAFLEFSELKPYEDAAHTGVWRTLTVRWSRRERRALVELLATPAPNKPLFTRELDRFVAVMRSVKREDGEPLVAGLSLQEYDGHSSPGPNHPRRLLFGAESLLDAYPSLNIIYRVSLGAFLQVNDAGAEKLYAVVRAFAVDGIVGARGLLGDSLPGRRAPGDAASAPGGLSWVDGGAAQLPTKRNSIALLDVCCGGGLIGLVCAPYFGRVIGVDECEAAIADARVNASLNGFSDVGAGARLQFECAKAETVMSALLPSALAMSGITGVVAVVDPPRSGLHPSVIAALRSCKALKRIVYVSCNPTKSFMIDTKRLCAPSGIFGAKHAPFRPVASVPFDLFPQTQGCELVTLFERDN